MRKLLLSIAILLSSLTLSAQADLGRQLWRNFNFGWDVYRTQDYRWRNIFIGSGYYYHFETFPKVYVYGGININWSKYTLYSNGRYGMDESNSYLRTTSFSVPLYAGYQVFKTSGFSLNLYTGPTFEMIVKSKLDRYPYDKINRFQTGWTTGSILQFLYLFRARVAYSYYPMSLLSDYNMPRSAFTVSIGF
ncbi:MAG TPA: outer membrane beta-barrel protein [Bacteroidales bacterium]|nr:outer membrane beta-barrel protein [Bacteroidales bacterium]